MRAQSSSHLGAKKMKRKRKRKCRKCGKEFNAVLDVWYCSGQCEILAHNPVAKFAQMFNRNSVHKSKKDYSRKRKHKNVELY